MREFFRGWQRKAGCFILFLACVLWCMWGASFHTYPASSISFRIADGNLVIRRVIRCDSGLFKSFEFAGETAIPIWSIVLPLTAISGWLILSKPRAKFGLSIAEDTNS